MPNRNQSMHPCEHCGKVTSLSYTAKLCKDCRFKAGTVYTLDMSLPMDDWHWELIDFSKETKK